MAGYIGDRPVPPVRKDPAGRLLFVNQAFCDMLGMTEAELAGRQIWELTHEEDVPENKRLYDRLMAEGTPFQFEKRMFEKTVRFYGQVSASHPSWTTPARQTPRFPCMLM